jgi:hypothetical protein
VNTGCWMALGKAQRGTISSSGVEGNMPLIKLRKANDTGKEVGVILVNTDQIVAISDGQGATELQMSDGRTRWVKETLEEIAALART